MMLSICCAGAATVALEPLAAGPATLACSSAPALAGQTSSRDFVDRLPAALAQLIFLLLHAHDRMRCRAVSRAWRAALADRACWRVLRFCCCEDLPGVSGIPGGLARLILAAGRAGGVGVKEIDVRGVLCDAGVLLGSLQRLAEENGESVRVLRFSGTRVFLRATERFGREVAVASWLEPGKMPRLEELEADVRAQSVGEARQLLDDARQPDGRFKILRIRTLDICADGVSVGGSFDTPQQMLAAAESLAEFLRTASPGHPSLTGLKLTHMPLAHPGLLDAVADAAVAWGLESLHLYGRYITLAFLPALSPALRCGRLRSLEVDSRLAYRNSGGRTSDELQRAHADFCAALRESRLENLRLEGMLVCASLDSSRPLLAALAAHPTLRSLRIDDDCESPGLRRIRETKPKAAARLRAAAKAITTLLEANAPALRSLCIAHCGLAGAHLERILRALHGNTHLAALECQQQRLGKG